MEDYLEWLVLSSNKMNSLLRENTYVEMCHGIVVSNLAQALAHELGEGKKFCEEIGVAGLLHDIGKLQLVRYLNAEQKEQLTVERMKYVRMHPTHSGQILNNAGYSEAVVYAVRSHHENFDGTGYPDNLKGDKIPWMARILRATDVFCALVSDRSYRRAFDRQSAIEIMIDEVQDYDMKVFLAFQRLFHSSHFTNTDGLEAEVTPLQKKHLGLFIQVAESMA